MNHWNHQPTRDEVLDKVYLFLQLLSQNRPIEAEAHVNVGSFSKFRDTLHYYLTDYILMITEDHEVYELPDDMSVAITDPHELNENEVFPLFSGKSIITEPNETISLFVGFQKEVTTIKLEFLLHKLDNKVYLNLMKVTKD